MVQRIRGRRRMDTYFCPGRSTLAVLFANRWAGWVRKGLAASVLAAASLVSSCHLFDFNGPSEPKILWRIPGREIGTPAFDGTTVFFNANDHHIVALEGNTGIERWRSATGSTEG